MTTRSIASLPLTIHEGPEEDWVYDYQEAWDSLYERIKKGTEEFPESIDFAV